MLTLVLIALIAVICFCVIALIVSIVLINRCYRQDAESKKDGEDEELDRFIETDDEYEKPLPSALPLDDIFYFGDVDISKEDLHSDEFPRDLRHVGDIRLEDGHGLPEHVAINISDTLTVVENSSMGTLSSTKSHHSVQIPVGASGQITDSQSVHTADEVIGTTSYPSIPANYAVSSVESVASDTRTGTGLTGRTGGLLAAAQKFQSTQQQLDGTFSQNANLKTSFEHMASIKCFRGIIQSIDGLNTIAKDSPQEIAFHVTFLPSKRFRMVTKYKPISAISNLSLSFTMGPVTADDLSKNIIRVRLYGKKSVLTRSKCYGQCTFKLDQMIGKSGYSDFNANLVPIPTGTIASDSDR